ncbi:MAG: DUF4358 domain-containing protein [Ruminococcaceae bacterium]|nr:DUF4358 domain-containing protein [Oscillospiraceae bacterium]
MKKITFVLLAFLLFLTLVSCTQTTPPEVIDNNTEQTENVVKNPTCEEIVLSVADALSLVASDFDYYNFTEEDKKLDDMVISYFYGDMESMEDPDFSNAVDYYIMVPVTTVATEVGVFKLDDPSAAEKMIGYFSNRAYARETTFAPYNEAESLKAKNALTGSYGNYVWYIMTDNNLEAEAKVLEAIK